MSLDLAALVAGTYQSSAFDAENWSSQHRSFDSLLLGLAPDCPSLAERVGVPPDRLPRAPDAAWTAAFPDVAPQDLAALRERVRQVMITEVSLASNSSLPLNLCSSGAPPAHTTRARPSPCRPPKLSRTLPLAILRAAVGFGLFFGLRSCLP